MYKEIQSLKQTLRMLDRVYIRTLGIMHVFAIGSLKQSVSNKTSNSLFNDIPMELIHIITAYLGNYFEFLFDSIHDSGRRIKDYIAMNDEPLNAPINVDRRYNENNMNLCGLAWIDTDECVWKLWMWGFSCCCLSPYPCLMVEPNLEPWGESLRGIVDGIDTYCQSHCGIRPFDNCLDFCFACC